MEATSEKMKEKSKKGGEKSGRKSESVLRDDCFRVLDDDNQAIPEHEPRIAEEQLLKMYQNMVLSRTLDERGMMLQRQGRIGFYVPALGQEAIATGTVAALQPSDWIFPSYREPGVLLYRGAPLIDMICNLFGNKGDVCKGRQMPNHYSFADRRIFSISSPIATQVIQAVGAAMAAKIKKEKDVSVCYFGDGGTSENDFHTGMTFAGAFKAPTVFICTNNQYAISVPVHKQCGARRLADKAAGYGMPGVSVDGNDVLAVYRAMSEAVERARNGEGPTMIECLTLRMGPHSSSDDPTRYRDAELYEAWKRRDPILRFREYLESQELWDEVQEEELQEEVKDMVMEAVEEAEKLPPPELETLFTDVYAELTPQLRRQKEALERESELRGKFENTSEAFPL